MKDERDTPALTMPLLHNTFPFMRIALATAAAAVCGILSGCTQCATKNDKPTPTTASSSARPPETSVAPQELVVKELKVGAGREAGDGARVSLVYTGTLPDGLQFDAWQDREKPFRFTIGSGVTIEGMDLGVRGMREGGIRQIIIPPHLAYGARSFGERVPPNATLQFEIELIKVE